MSLLPAVRWDKGEEVGDMMMVVVVKGRGLGGCLQHIFRAFIYFTVVLGLFEGHQYSFLLLNALPLQPSLRHLHPFSSSIFN